MSRPLASAVLLEFRAGERQARLVRVLDIANPAKPSEISRLKLSDTFAPHWTLASTLPIVSGRMDGEEQTAPTESSSRIKTQRVFLPGLGNVCP